MKMRYEEEANKIYRTLNKHLEKKLDGKKCVLELKNANYQWRQMEWIGWYIEFKLKNILINEIDGRDGPQYGNTKFDYIREFPWDFKAHILNSRSHPWIILNDCEAVNQCIKEYTGIGYVIISGIAEYDLDGSFKRWHNILKGKETNYVKDRKKRGAPSRMRKKTFEIKNFNFLWLDENQISIGLKEKWLKNNFQLGMRNADGTLRRPKYLLNIEKAPCLIVK